MISLTDIHKYLKNEEYQDLIKELNKSLNQENDNPTYYFYRFLAYNHDYFHMDIEDLSDEIDLNKALELKGDYSYQDEFFFLKELSPRLRALFVYALRMDKEKLLGLIKERNQKDILENFSKGLRNFCLNLDEDNQIIYTLMVIKWVFHSLDGIRDKDKKNKEEIKEIYAALKSRLLNSSIYNLEESLDLDIFYLDHATGELLLSNGHLIYGNDSIEIKNGILIKYAMDDKNIIIPEKVEEIPAGFFMGMDIKTVKLPSTLRKIGADCFRGCSALVEVSFNEGLKEIGANAFLDCISLSSITLPKSLEVIGANAFIGDKKLIEVYNLSKARLSMSVLEEGYFHIALHKSIKDRGHILTIGDFQFILQKKEFQMVGYLGSDENLILPKDCLGKGYDISHHAFYRNKEIRTIQISGGVNRIHENAFGECINLTKVVIEEGVKEIGRFAFRSCPRLAQIILPKTLFDIGEDAFSDCNRLVEIYNPSRVALREREFNVGQFHTAIHKSLDIKSHMIEFGDFQFVYVGKKYQLFNYSGIKKDIVLPKIPGLIYDIFSEAFSNSDFITSVKIPKGVEVIGPKAFFGCKALRSVTMEDVIRIEDYAFKDCKVLSSISLGNYMEHIGFGAFDSCLSLASITIPKTVREIELEAFYSCDKLVEIYNLSKFKLTKGEYEQNQGFFKTILHSLESKRSHLVTIGDFQFILRQSDHEYCLMNYLGDKDSPTLPRKVFGGDYSIYRNAFYANSNIISIKIPPRVKSIGEFAFRDCNKLSVAYIPKGVGEIKDGAFYGLNRLVSIDILEGLEKIGTNAFYDCSHLKSIILPSSIKELGKRIVSKETEVYLKMKKPLIGLPSGFDKSFVEKKTKLIWNYREESYDFGK